MSNCSPIKQLPMKFTKSSFQREKSSTKLKQKLQQSQYFCHFSNALYMGGMRAYKKNDKGIILHDDGTSAIVSYISDVPSGHHVIFRSGIIISKIHNLNRKNDIALRIDRFLIQIPYNQQQEPDGKGILIDFKLQKIWNLVYKKGSLKQKKIIKDSQVIDNVFYKRNLKVVIDEIHQSAFDFKFDKHKNISVFKQGDKVWIGFANQKNMLNGLAFKLNISKKQKWDNIQFQCSILQRGYYVNSQLHGFGEKSFKNKNLYYGNFYKDQFQGKGYISYPEKNKWIYGNFKSDKLKDIIEVNNQQSKGQSWRKGVRKLHSYDQKWIDLKIILQGHKQLIQLLNQCLNVEGNQNQVNKRSIQKYHHKVTMNKIQQSLVFSNSRVQNDNTMEIAERQKEKSLERKNNFEKDYCQSTKSRSNSKSKSKSKSHKQKNKSYNTNKNIKKSAKQLFSQRFEIKQPKKHTKLQYTPKNQRFKFMQINAQSVKQAQNESDDGQVTFRQNQTLGYKTFYHTSNKNIGNKETFSKSPVSRLNNNKDSKVNKSFNSIKYVDIYCPSKNNIQILSKTPIKDRKTNFNFNTEISKIARTIQNEESSFKNYQDNESYHRRTHYKYLYNEENNKKLKNQARVSFKFK